MGYDITCTELNVSIPAHKAAEALAAINALHTPENLLDQATGGCFRGGFPLAKWYKFVRNPAPGGFTSLPEALDAWRYDAGTLEDGSTVVWQFTGQKLGDDWILWRALGSFVAEGGILAWEGEDGQTWAYHFADGAMRQEGEIEWS